MELREALRLFLQVDRAASTRETYRKVLERFVEDIGPGRPLKLIRPEDLDAYVLKLREVGVKYADHPSRPRVAEPLASATIYKRIKTIKRFFNWCVQRGFIQQSPARFLTNKRPIRPLGQGKAATDQEVSEILAAARYQPRNWAIVLLLVQSGARASEIAGLQISNLYLDEGRAVIDGKGDKRRWIYFGPETADAIRAWFKVRPEDADHDYVFTSTRGHGKLNAQAISQITRRLCRVAGLKRTLGAHAFRHFVGMKLARSKVPAPVIQRYLGHENIDTTMGYLRSINDDDVEAAGKLLSLIHHTGDDDEIAKLFRRDTG